METGESMSCPRGKICRNSIQAPSLAILKNIKNPARSYTSLLFRMPLDQPPQTPLLYEHDLNESLDSMTLVCPTAPRATVSSSCCTVTAPNSKESQDRTRIPRRVKSTPHANASERENAESEKLKRSATSVVTNCLLTTASSLGGGGSGDGVSLDQEVELWLEMIPLSKKPFRNFHRDFSDGVLMAELLSHYLPKRVDLHNYPPSSSTHSKMANWHTLNQKVLSKLGLRLSDPLIEGISQSKPGYVEKALKQVHRLVENLDRKHLDTRAKHLSCLAASFDGTNMRAPFVEDWCLVRNVPGEVPDCVIYQNIKYYGCGEFEDVQRQNEQLRERNNELSSKVRRMETLMGLKEAHLSDLTRKIHELRGKYERSNSFGGGGGEGDEEEER